MFRTRSTRVRIALAGGVVALGAIGIVPASASGASYETNALHVAQSKIGDPEQSGAAGPDSFDCSGLTSYSYQQAGHPIPRTAQEQYDASTHESQSAKQPGDLIFFGSPGHITHVGVFEGGNNMIAVSSSASSVVRQSIYDSNYLVGRF